MSIARHCELISMARASWYNQPQGETEENLLNLRRINEEYAGIPVAERGA